MRINAAYAKQTLANLEEAGLQHYDINSPKPYEVPTSFREFFQEFGGLEHDGKRGEDNRPLVVKDLAPYQYEFADLRYGFMLKCNKIGMTTSEMLRDFHYLLMPENAGFDILLQAAKIELANELLLNLKTKIQNSPKYRKYMVTRPENILRAKKESCDFMSSVLGSVMCIRLIPIRERVPDIEEPMASILLGFCGLYGL